MTIRVVVADGRTKTSVAEEGVVAAKSAVAVVVAVGETKVVNVVTETMAGAASTIDTNHFFHFYFHTGNPSGLHRMYHPAKSGCLCMIAPCYSRTPAAKYL